MKSNKNFSNSLNSRKTKRLHGTNKSTLQIELKKYIKDGANNNMLISQLWGIVIDFSELFENLMTV